MKIQLSHVTKRFFGVTALLDVSLELQPGITAMIGANGAGKSTLLHLLGSVLIPSQGSIDLDGQPLTRDRIDLRKRIALLPDQPPVVPHATPIEHIGDYLRLYDAYRPGVEDLTVSLLRDFDLLPLAEVKLSELSRGQTYKAALTALIAADPEVWLLDEPFAAGMDPPGVAVLRHQMEKAVGRGRTIVYSTQIVELAEGLSDRVLILNRGKLLAYDSLGSLKRIHGDAERLLERLIAGAKGNE